MEHGTDRPRSGRPLIYGEVLFDCFPDGSEVLGGAPFNVAWHLQGFGAAPLFVGRVGSDPRGARVLEAMRSWGLDTSGIQQADTHPTGQVSIRLVGNGHEFSILPDQAYDHIDTAVALGCVTTAPALLYCGTLIARAAPSRAALNGLLEATGAPAFVDVNLRAPWWTRDGVEALIGRARWLKLNEDELALLRGPAASVEAAETQADALRKDSGIAWVILTRGADGASMVGDRRHRGAPPVITHPVDSIGAGDAFSAVTILGLLHDWDMAVTLERALGFAARICEQRGATAADRPLYADLRREWGI